MAKTIFAKEQLRSIVERIERLEEEKATLATDIKEVYAEAKGNGFDTKAIRKIVRIRKKDQTEQEEEDAILDLYKSALGMLSGTPLGDAAIARDIARDISKKGKRASLSDDRAEA